MPTASQVSMYDTVMASTSMPLQYIKESSQKSNSNHYNPMSINELLDKKPTLCLSSGLDQSGDPWDRTSTSMNTFGET